MSNIIQANTDVQITDGNASPSAYGWCFQVGAGISLLLDSAHLKTFEKIKIEGASDDIEITLDDGKRIYAQAKSVTQIGDQRNAVATLEKALETLGNDELRVKKERDEGKSVEVAKLIYITNIANPLLSSLPSAFSFGDTYDFSDLSDADQQKIRDKMSAEKPFDTSKFQLRIIKFFGTGNNKFQSIKEQISEFLRGAIDDPSYSQDLLESWFETFMVNAADRPRPDNEKDVTLTKRQVIFPVIALIIKPYVSESEFAKVSDYENYAEVTQEFRRMIAENVYDYDFFTQVLGDYNEKRKMVTDKTSFKYKFATDAWKDYEQYFSRIKSDEKRQAIVQSTLLTVIMQREKIQQIKEAAGIK